MVGLVLESRTRIHVRMLGRATKTAHGVDTSKLKPTK